LSHRHVAASGRSAERRGQLIHSGSGSMTPTDPLTGKVAATCAKCRATAIRKGTHGIDPAIS
jgi:hypothetical protein